MTPEHRHQHNEKQLETVHPNFAAKVRLVLADLEKATWQPLIAEAFRTAAQQAEKVKLGYSKVSFSFHCATCNGHPAALAVDVVDVRYNWEVSQEHPFWKALGRSAKAHGLVWGGDWKFKDVAHIQYLGNEMLKQVRAGYSPALIETPEEDEMEKTKITVNGKTYEGRFDPAQQTNLIPFAALKPLLKPGVSISWHEAEKRLEIVGSGK